jgi:hypothetical protein
MKRTTSALLALAIAAAPATSLAQDTASDDGVGMGGRIEVPGAGYAVTFPEDWVHIRPTQGDAEVILDEVSRLAPGLVPTIEGALAGGLAFSVLAYGEPTEGFVENCNILDRVADGRSLDLVAAGEVTNLGGLGELIASGPDLTFIEIPIGRIARIDVGLRLPETDLESTSFIIVDTDWIHTLSCTGDMRPTDAWAPIVGTFELLPPLD